MALVPTFFTPPLLKLTTFMPPCSCPCSPAVTYTSPASCRPSASPMKLLGARASLALAFTLYACVAPSVLAAPCARCSRGLRGQKQQRALRAQHKAAHHKAAAPKPEPPKAAPAAAPSANVTAEKQRDPPRHFLPVKDSYKLPRGTRRDHPSLAYICLNQVMR
jgi:hypothetical protein